jgi:hypothetical protein
MIYFVRASYCLPMTVHTLVLGFSSFLLQSSPSFVCENNAMILDGKDGWNLFDGLSFRLHFAVEKQLPA